MRCSGACHLQGDNKHVATAVSHLILCASECNLSSWNITIRAQVTPAVHLPADAFEACTDLRYQEVANSTVLRSFCALVNATPAQQGDTASISGTAHSSATQVVLLPTNSPRARRLRVQLRWISISAAVTLAGVACYAVIMRLRTKQARCGCSLESPDVSGALKPALAPQLQVACEQEALLLRRGCMSQVSRHLHLRCGCMSHVSGKHCTQSEKGARTQRPPAQELKCIHLQRRLWEQQPLFSCIHVHLFSTWREQLHRQQLAVW
jgi:hypothetical protein